MTEPFVVSAVCVRRRPWVAAGWVAAMAAQSRRPDAVLVVVDEDDARDGTYEAWWSTSLLLCPWSLVAVCRYPHPSAPGHGRQPDAEGHRYSDDQHAHLARLRNWTVERALELWPQCTHVWCTDSDVQPEPDVLGLLLAADKPVVGAVVRNSAAAWNFMCGATGAVDGTGTPYRNGQEATWLAGSTRPFEVTLVGACTLFEADLFRGQGLGSMDRRDGFGAAAGLLRWGPHPRGEDVALAIQARELGVSLWVEPRARCAHFMNGPDQEPLR